MPQACSTQCVPKPILKWAGGKTRLLPQLLPLLPRQVREMRYFEPFLGGGALFFALQPARAVLGDINASLCHMYSQVRDDVETVVVRLRELASSHSQSRYYEIRAAFNRQSQAPSARAAMFIYLNRTCYNGLHRQNRRGEFNVPANDVEGPWSVDVDAIYAAHAGLQHAVLRHQSFEDLLADAGQGDFVYCDPPYAQRPGGNSFTRYNASDFGCAEQSALRDVFGELDRRGCSVMLSNSDTPENRRRYADFSISTVHAPRVIGCRSSSRTSVPELVIRNYV